MNAKQLRAIIRRSKLPRRLKEAALHLVLWSHPEAQKFLTNDRILAAIKRSADPGCDFCGGEGFVEMSAENFAWRAVCQCAEDGAQHLAANVADSVH